MPDNSGEKVYKIKIVIDQDSLKDSARVVKDQTDKLLSDTQKTTSSHKSLWSSAFGAISDGAKKMGSGFTGAFSAVGSGLTSLMGKFKLFEKQASEAPKMASVGWKAFLGGFAGAALVGAFKLVSGGISLVRGQVQGLIKEATENEDALNNLNTALALTGKYSEGASARLNNFADSLEKSSKFGQDAILNASALIQKYGNLSVDQLEKATKAAIDLAAGTGKSLETTAEALAKASAGNTTALGEMGIKFDETKTKAGDFANAIDAINRKFGGSAIAAMNNFSGASKQLDDSIGNFQEKIGYLITKNPAVIVGLQTITKVFAQLESFVDDNRKVFMDLATTVFAAVVKGAFWVGDALLGIGQKFYEMKAGIKGLTTEAMNALDTFAIWVGKKFNKFTADDVKAIQDRIDARNKAYDEDFEAAKKNFEALGGLREKLAAGDAEVQEKIKTKAKQTKDFLKELNTQSIQEQKDALTHMGEDEKWFLDWKATQEKAFYEEQTNYRSKLIAEEEQRKLDQLEKDRKFGDAKIEILKAQQEAQKNYIFSFKKWEDMNYKERYSSMKDVLGEMSALQNSKNKEMFRIGQAAAAANAAIATGEGAIKAYSSLAGIPFIGPALGAAAATALILFGAEQQRQIWSQQPPVGAATGGVVAGANVPLSGDKAYIRVNRKERVLTPEQNRAFEEMVYNGNNLGGNNSEVVTVLSAIRDDLRQQPNIYMDSDKVNEAITEVKDRRL